MSINANLRFELKFYDNMLNRYWNIYLRVGMWYQIVVSVIFIVTEVITLRVRVFMNLMVYYQHRAAWVPEGCVCMHVHLYIYISPSTYACVHTQHPNIRTNTRIGNYVFTRSINSTYVHTHILFTQYGKHARWARTLSRTHCSEAARKIFI